MIRWQNVSLGENLFSLKVDMHFVEGIRIALVVGKDALRDLCI